MSNVIFFFAQNFKQLELMKKFLKKSWGWALLIIIAVMLCIYFIQPNESIPIEVEVPYKDTVSIEVIKLNDTIK